MSTIHSSIGRRTAIKLSAAATLGLPSIGHAAQNTLRYVPYSNLIVFDPVWAISIIGLEHAYMTCDQLFGLDESFNVQPQMAAGHELSDDRLRWRITLRDGLVFHDGEKVRAIDCVASINRWSKRDPFGRAHGRAARRDEGARRQELRDPPQTPVRAHAVRSRRHHLLHPSRTAGEDRHRHADHRRDRQRPVPISGR